MALTYRRITQIPEDGYRRGPRDSVCLDVVSKLREDPTQILSVEGTDRAEVQRFYKAMIQWRSRHKELGLSLRKGTDAIYCWISEQSPA